MPLRIGLPVTPSEHLGICGHREEPRLGGDPCQERPARPVPGYDRHHMGVPQQWMRHKALRINHVQRTGQQHPNLCTIIDESVDKALSMLNSRKKT